MNPPSRQAGDGFALRPFGEDDRHSFVRLFTHPQVMRFVGSPMASAGADTLFDAHLSEDADHPRLHTGWAIELAADPSFVGSASILRNQEYQALEIGFLLMPRFGGQGLGTRVARLLLHIAHNQLGQARMLATVDPGNSSSMRVLEKAGMRRIGHGTDDRGAYHLYERVWLS